jgi:flagellar motor switch protein FliM
MHHRFDPEGGDSMSDLLDEDQIARLFDQAAKGKLPEDLIIAGPPSRNGGPQKRARGLRTIDFQHPTKFTADQERRIKRALEQFCRTANRRLSAELRVEVELEVIDVMQLTWFNAHAQIPYDSVCGVLDGGGQGADTRMLLSAEQSLVVNFIERLLGGSQVGRERKLTDIDLVLAKRFFAAMTEELSQVWEELARAELSLLRLVSQPESANVASASEPTLALVMEGRLDRVSSTVVLLVPYRSAGGVVDAFGAGDDQGARDPRIARSVDAALREVAVTVRAEVAATEISLEDVLALRPGDTITFPAPVSEGVTIMADKVPVHRAAPGKSGRRRAVQVTRPLEEDR